MTNVGPTPRRLMTNVGLTPFALFGTGVLIVTLNRGRGGLGVGAGYSRLGRGVDQQGGRGDFDGGRRLAIGRAAAATPLSGGRISEDQTMWRSFFLAVGVFLMILGVECLGVETVNLKMREPPPQSSGLPFDNGSKLGPNKKITPPPWAPWSLLSTGAVVCIYSFTIPRRVKSDK